MYNTSTGYTIPARLTINLFILLVQLIQLLLVLLLTVIIFLLEAPEVLYSLLHWPGESLYKT